MSIDVRVRHEPRANKKNSRVLKQKLRREQYLSNQDLQKKSILVIVVKFYAS